MKIMKKFFGGTVLLLLALFLTGHVSEAAESTEKVNVTVPSELIIVFDEDGTNGIGEFYIRNQSPVSITVDSVYVTECNEWKLVPYQNAIGADIKELAFSLEGHALQAGENQLQISVSQNAEQKLDVAVKRGAWTSSEDVESAFCMEFSYTVGKATFQLKLNANGGLQVESPIRACNGEKVTLPTPKREGYDFVGWEDEAGNVYMDFYLMQIGDVTLTAKWALATAYAVYSEDDCSLTFYNTSKTITVGSTYNGKKVTAVYTDFLNQGYEYRKESPWSVDYGTDIQKVIVADRISPTTTKGWFLYLRNCTYVDVTNLDTSKVTNMEQMFSLTGNNPTTFRLIGMKNWDVSKVTDMSSMFNGTGRNATTFYIDDISGWNVSNVTDMYAMFVYTGKSSTAWSLDLRGWNVQKVTNHNNFDSSSETQIIDPIWVH